MLVCFFLFIFWSHETTWLLPAFERTLNQPVASYHIVFSTAKPLAKKSATLYVLSHSKHETLTE